MRVFKKKVLLSNQPWMSKRRRRGERSRDDRSQPDHIPLDLTLEILSRLPAKSILRYRCVSKLWSSLVRLPSFINSFASRSSARSPLLLITFFSRTKFVVFSCPQNQNPDGSYSPVYSYHMTNLNGHWIFPLSKSVQGLILLFGLKIWNPTLRRVLTLPHPNEEHTSCMSYLGYDPLEGKHKVLSLSILGKSVQPLVLTLGDQESWRIITKNIPMHHPYEQHGRCFNGVLYYRVYVDNERIIMSFDVRSESFKPIIYPKDLSRLYFHITPYEGRLALVTNTWRLQEVDLYILKDADGHEWTHQRFLHIPCKSEWRDHMVFEGITDAGELIFARFRFSEPFYIVYFDPKRNSTREALFEGIMGGDFARRCGLGSPHTMGVLPNHTESLVCL